MASILGAELRREESRFLSRFTPPRYAPGINPLRQPERDQSLAQFLKTD